MLNDIMKMKNTTTRTYMNSKCECHCLPMNRALVVIVHSSESTITELDIISTLMIFALFND